jgi:Uma2 family endonuclease
VIGIVEYCIVDPLLRQVSVLTRSGEGWKAEVAKDDAAIPSLVLPRLSFPVADLWVGLLAQNEYE